MTEQYVDIPGYEGNYQISNLGNIISLKKSCPMLLKPMVATNGYLVACLWKYGKQKKILVHRLVTGAFLLPLDGCNEVNHIDENKYNNRVDNLEWCSHAYNMNYGSVRQKIGLANTGRVFSDEYRRRQATDTSNRRWINDGIKERYIPKQLLDSYVADDWNVGRLGRRHKNV